MNYNCNNDCLQCAESVCVLDICRKNNNTKNNIKNKGRYIRAARRKEKLTQQQLADILHVSRQTINNWECDRVTIPRHRYARIREYFAR